MLEVYHYYDGPKLFSCSNSSGHFFLVFWLGDDENELYQYDRWMYIPISKTRLAHVQTGAISLRDACINAEDGFVWVISVSFDNSKSQIEFLNSNSIAGEDLPEEDARLKFKTETINKIEGIDEYAKRARVDVLDIALDDNNNTANEVSSKALGIMLINTQDVIDYIHSQMNGYKSYKIPEKILQYSKFKAVDAFPSSFGIRLEADKSNEDLFGNSKLENSLHLFFKIISCGDDFEKLLPILGETSSFAIAKYLSLVNGLAKFKVNLKTKWATPKNINSDIYNASITWKQATAISSILSSALENFVDIINIEQGKLVGIDIEKGAFRLVDELTNQKYEGKINLEYAKKLSAKVPGVYKVKIDVYNKSKTGDNKISTVYNLRELIDGTELKPESGA